MPSLLNSPSPIVSYLRLPFTAALGFLLFTETPDAMAVAGAVIIVAASVLCRPAVAGSRYQHPPGMPTAEQARGINTLRGCRQQNKSELPAGCLDGALRTSPERPCLRPVPCHAARREAESRGSRCERWRKSTMHCKTPASNLSAMGRASGYGAGYDGPPQLWTSC